MAETRRHFPFDLERRREAGVLCDDKIILFAVKGAWESLRPLVAQVESPQGEKLLPADDVALAACDVIVHDMSSRGQRVIAVAYRHLRSLPSPTAAEESLERNLILKGFLALDDPLRDDVPAAVLSCHAAGIRVILVTGDHPDTAEAVARQCGILRPQEPREGRIILGHELAEMGDNELAERLRQLATVFARTTPEQKVKIVAALKGLGHVVGMTGDGVNDAAALKAADVGIAMGVGGTDVARESADIVLLDNSFASIVAGVEEGRAVFNNIRKFTTYVLASNIPEIVPYLLYIVFPVPLALTIIQILSVDLGTDLLPAIGLGQEPPETDVLKQPPRRADERLLVVSRHGHCLFVSGDDSSRVLARTVFFRAASRRVALGSRITADRRALSIGDRNYARLGHSDANRKPRWAPITSAVGIGYRPLAQSLDAVGYRSGDCLFLGNSLLSAGADDPRNRAGFAARLSQRLVWHPAPLRN